MKTLAAMTRSLASLAILAWFSLRRRATAPDYWSLDRQARRIVNESLRDNVWRRSATPGSTRHFLLWGGRYPLRFAAVVGVVSAGIAAAFLPAPLQQLAVIPLPTLPCDYNHSSFFGTVWSVQATLVALVYPFVLTFVAVMLQRRAASKIALTVYLLDSAVLPAGTSSLLLLAVLAVQYFSLVAAPSDLFFAAAVFNGVWFLVNTALTGFFLAKTIRYIEDEVGQRAYRNLAVSLVLRDELTASLSKHLLTNAPERLNWQAPSSIADEHRPEVQLLSLSRGKAQVIRTFGREATFVDAHLGALEWVARRWLARARSDQQQAEVRARKPVLRFRSMLHGTSIGPVELCSVANGPDLTPLETEVVRRAFVFGKRPRSLVTDSTTDMLEELATEVHSLMEQGRSTASRQAFHRMVDLHIGLLGACHEAGDVEGDVSSAAGLARSPYSWGGQNLNTTWLRPYRELVFSAVRQLERDQTLLSSLAHAASDVIARSELQPPQLVAELFSLPQLIDHAMASWWLKEAQRAGAKPNAEGYVLPQPAVEDYRKAVVTLVSGIESFRYAYSEGPVNPAVAWKRRCRAARSWASHVDLAATLLLNAVSRGDGAAAEWYSDNLAAWWGNHHYELDYGHHVEYDPGLSGVRLGITELDWQSAGEKLAGLAKRPVDIEEAQKVIWHAVRRYWESMRMVVCLLLLQQAEAGKFQVLATRIAANLARHRLFHEGPRSEGLDLSDADELLGLFVDTCFADSWVERRLDAFCEERDRWTDRAPVVSGWIYSGTGGATDIRSKAVALSQLLLATQPNARETWRKTSDALGREAMDLLALGQLASMADSFISTYRQKSFRPYFALVAALRGTLEKGALTVGERRSVFKGYVRLRREALARREAGLKALSVSQQVVDDFVKRLSVAMVAPDVLTDSHAFCSVRVGTAPSAYPLIATGFKFTKEQFTQPPLIAISDAEVKQLATDFMSHTVAEALNQLLVARGAFPIAHPDDTALLTNVQATAERLRATGFSPVAIVSAGSPAMQALRPYHWGRPGQPSLPTGIQLSHRKPGVYEFANGFINDTPIISLLTPSEATFVVPLEWMRTLVLEPKPLGVVEVSHAVTGTNEVSVRFAWDASLQSN